MEGILHSNSVHSQILFNTTYLNIYVEEKHDSSVIIQYVRRDHDEMQIRKNVTATSLFVTPSTVRNQEADFLPLVVLHEISKILYNRVARLRAQCPLRFL